MSRSRLNRSRNRLHEAAYIDYARQIVKAGRLIDQAEAKIAETKRNASKAMHAVGVTEFEFETEVFVSHPLEQHKTKIVKYEAALMRKPARRVSVEKLYGLVRGGEITLDEFLLCVKADAKEVEALIGRDRLPSVIEGYYKPLDLVIEPK